MKYKRCLIAKKLTGPQIASKLDEFRNQAVCRDEVNQHAARKMWEEIKLYLTEEEIFDISDIWIHYKLGEHSTNDFGATIRDVASKYRKLPVFRKLQRHE